MKPIRQLLNILGRAKATTVQQIKEESPKRYWCADYFRAIPQGAKRNTPLTIDEVQISRYFSRPIRSTTSLELLIQRRLQEMGYETKIGLTKIKHGIGDFLISVIPADLQQTKLPTISEIRQIIHQIGISGLDGWNEIVTFRS
jgi:hypothetical protein